MILKREHAFSCFRTKRRSHVAFGCKTKNDLLSAFCGDRFYMHLAYLADIFEALNRLNKKLQRPGNNIIVQTDVINAFVAKFNLWI